MGPPVQKVAELLTRLKEIRAATGISANHLGHLMGVSAQRVTAWEAGAYTHVTYTMMPRLNRIIECFDVASGQLEQRGLAWKDMVPMRQVAMMMGVGSYSLVDRLDNMGIEVFHLTGFGSWLRRVDEEECRKW